MSSYTHGFAVLCATSDSMRGFAEFACAGTTRIMPGLGLDHQSGKKTIPAPVGSGSHFVKKNRRMHLGVTTVVLGYSSRDL